MRTVKKFEDLEIWQLARELLKLIYDDFRACKDFSFRNQITEAGISIVNNISEGFSRESDKEFKQFLNISRDPMEKSEVCTILLRIKSMLILKSLTIAGTEPKY